MAADENVTINGAKPVMKVIWQVNPVTLAAIFSATVTGAIYINTIDNRVTANTNAINGIVVKMNDLTDIPFRMKVAENNIISQNVKDDAQNARMDRLADLVVAGQDAMRKDVQQGFDTMRKDISSLTTKVEVVGSKVDQMTGKPQPGTFRYR